MKQKMQEREEQWVAQVRRTLRQAEEPLPAGGWETLQRDLAAAGRRRAVFGLGWRRAAAAAVVAAGTLFIIGETVLFDRAAVGDESPSAAEYSAGSGAELSADGDAIVASRRVAAVAKISAEASENPDAAKESDAKAAAVRSVLRSASEPRPGTARSDAGATGGEQSGISPVEAKQAAKSPFGEPAPAPTASENGFGGVPESASASESAGESAVPEKASRRTIVRSLPDTPSSNPAACGRAAHRTSFGLYAAGLPAAQRVSSGQATPIPTKYVLSSSGMVRLKRGYDDYLYRHKQPLSFGFSIRKEFSHDISLESGLVYSLLRSDVRATERDKWFGQTLHMLGIPLRVNWNFLVRSGWKLYVGGGGMVEKNLYARFGSESIAEKRLQWSLAAGAGVQYDFTQHTGLYFEPGVSYYLTETDLRTARTSSPANLSLSLGVRLTY